VERAAVVGATGFIGSQLVNELLQRGSTVDVLVRHPESWSVSLPVRNMWRADITHEDSLREPLESVDVVYHLAGRNLARTPQEYRRVNVEGTENIVRACAACDKPPRLVFVSSVAALGPTTADQPLAEDATPQPVSHYGRSKRDAEERLRAYADRVPITIVRPPSVIGARDPYMLSLFQWALRGWVFVPVNRQCRYSYIHVQDLSAALIPLAQYGQRLSVADRAAGIYHVADPQSMTFIDLATAVAAVAGRPAPKSVVLPRWVCQVVGLGGELADRLSGRRGIVNLDKIREGIAGSWWCDTTRWSKANLYRFPVTLEQRIAQTVAGYQESGKLSR